MRPYQFTSTAYPAADPNGIATAQTLAGAAAFDLDGVLASGGVATITPPAYVTITSSGNDTGVTFTITGQSPEGWPQTEAVTGASGGAATSTSAWSEVSAVVSSGATDGDAEVGTAQAGYGVWLPLDIMVPNQVTTISTDIAGTLNYTWQFTNDSVWPDPPAVAVDPATVRAISHPVGALVGASADQYGSTTVLMRAVRFVVNSGSGTARNVVTQQSTQ